MLVPDGRTDNVASEVSVAMEFEEFSLGMLLNHK